MRKCKTPYFPWDAFAPNPRSRAYPVENANISSPGETMSALFKMIAALFGRLFSPRREDEFKARLLADLGLKG